MHSNSETELSNPFVSVVICTYNRADYLKKCLDSMIVQSYNNFEVIVVNGPSTDATDSLLKRYPYSIVRQKRKGGLSAARNLGIKAAKGEIIAIIDDDAIADKNWIQNFARKYENDSTGCVGGLTYSVNNKGEIIEKTMEWEVNKFGRSRCSHFNDNESKNTWFKYVHGCNTSFRKKVLDEIGGFDEYYTYWLDESDVCVRIAKAGYNIEYQPGAVVYHLREGSKRPDIWYHIGDKQSYFTFKNFGDELRLREIIWVDIKNFIYDLKTITINLLRYDMPLLDYLASTKNMVSGRIQGYKNGIRLRKIKTG